MRTVLTRWRHWKRRRTFDRDLSEEIETHRSLRQGQLEESGVPPRAAEAASRRALGNITLAREDAREVWIWRWLGDLARDLRHGARLLRRSPGFTTVAVLSLSIGIGANTAIFTLVDAVILKTLPVDMPGRLVVLERVNTRGERSNLSYALFDELRAPGTGFASVFAALDGAYRLDMTRAASGGDAEPVRVQAVSGEYFQVLGVRAALGRALTPEDDRRGRTEAVTVLSHRFWQRRFGGDASIIGQRLSLKGQSLAVIGVAPPSFFGESVGRAPDMWVPLTLQPALDPPALLNDPRVGWLRVMARLRPDTSVRQAQEVLDARLSALKAGSGEIAQALRQVDRIAAEPGSHGLTDTRTRFQEQLWILMAVVAILLLIACANVASLLLVRGAARSREAAVRLAIGAGRGRLVRQFLTESMLLAVLGGAAGLVLARWGSELLLSLASPDSSPLAIDVSPDARVLAFTFAVALVAVLMFGLAPACAATRSIAIRTRASRRALTLPRALVVAQVGLALLLLMGAGLLVQTLRNLRTIDLGFASEEIIQVQVNAQQSGYSREQLPDLYRRLLDRLNAAPGIRSASMSSSGFRTGTSRTCCIAIRGHIPEPGEDREVQTMNVTADYFRTMGLSMRRGRTFSAADLDGAPASPKVAIVNEALARRYFGAVEPVGQRFGWGNPSDATYDIEIVGVAADAIYGDLRTGARPLVYVPGTGGRYLVVRAALSPLAVAGTVQREIQAVDGHLQLDVKTVPQLREQAVLLERLLATLSGLFGAVAVLLASIGLYGLMAYAVTRRTKEIGIRVALGAQRSRVVREIVRESLGLAAAGMAVGGCATWITTRIIAGTLFGVSPTDPMTLAFAAMLLTAVALSAAVLPARRAARIDPGVALRYE